jgi:hypothetical protein
MAFNFEEGIAELRAQEKRLEEELEEVRAAIPALVRLRNRQVLPPVTASKKFSGMGATKAIPQVLREVEVPLTSSEILDRLRAGGWTTGSQKPLSTVSATLSQLETVERVGEGWRLRRTLTSSIAPQQPSLQ